MFLFGCGAAEPEMRENTSFCLEKPFKNDVEFREVKREKVVESIHLTGSVDANPDRVIHFVSLVGGVVSNTFFSLGDVVSKGQVLMHVSSPELSALHAELITVDARIESKQLHLEATETMYADGLASQQVLLDARNALRVLYAEKQKIESVLHLYSASATENVFKIRAPVSGIITAKGINPGMSITDTGESLFSISDLNDVWVMVNVYATNVQHVTEGMPVDITTISYPNDVFKGEIKALSHILDEESNVLKARVVIDNIDHKLKPGMIADVVAHKPRNEEAVAVPVSAVVFADNQDYVLVYHDDCNIEARPITIMAKNEDAVYINTGLEEYEQIIVKNQLLVFEAIRY